MKSAWILIVAIILMCLFVQYFPIIFKILASIFIFGGIFLLLAFTLYIFSLAKR